MLTIGNKTAAYAFDEHTNRIGVSSVVAKFLSHVYSACFTKAANAIKVGKIPYCHPRDISKVCSNPELYLIPYLSNDKNTMRGEHREVIRLIGMDIERRLRSPSQILAHFKYDVSKMPFGVVYHIRRKERIDLNEMLGLSGLLSTENATSTEREEAVDETCKFSNVSACAMMKLPSPEEMDNVMKSLFTPEMLGNPVYRFRMENTLHEGATRKEVEQLQREIWDEVKEKANKKREAKVEIARARANAKVAEARIAESQAVKRKRLDDDEDDMDVDARRDGALCSTFMFEELRKTLGEPNLNFLKTACHVLDCDNTVSPFMFGVCGDSRCSLTLCCLECAEESDCPITRVYRMSRKKSLVWLSCAGTNRTLTCAACGLEEYPIDILDGWEMGHRKAAACGGRSRVENLFPVHPRCNKEQGTSSLETVRSLGRLDGTPAFPMGLQLKTAKTELKRMVTF